MGLIKLWHVSHDKILFIILDVTTSWGEVHFALEFSISEYFYKNGLRLRHKGGHEHLNEYRKFFGIFGFKGDFLYFLECEFFCPDVALEFILNLNRKMIGFGDDMNQIGVLKVWLKKLLNSPIFLKFYRCWCRLSFKFWTWFRGF